MWYANAPAGLHQQQSPWTHCQHAGCYCPVYGFPLVADGQLQLFQSTVAVYAFFLRSADLQINMAWSQWKELVHKYISRLSWGMPTVQQDWTSNHLDHLSSSELCICCSWAVAALAKYSCGVGNFLAISWLAMQPRHGRGEKPQFGHVITYITSSSIGTKKHVLHMLTPSSVGSAYFQKELHCQTMTTKRNPNEIMVHSTTRMMDAFSKNLSNQQGNTAKIKPYNWLC